MIRKKPKKATQYDAERYNKILESIGGKDRTERPYAEHTELNLGVIWEAWSTYCKHKHELPQIFMARCEDEDLKHFWIWYLENSKVNSEETLKQYQKRLSLLYKRHVGKSMHPDMAEELRNFIKVKLRKKYKLNLKPGKKAVMSVDDLVRVLQLLWASPVMKFPDERQRVQHGTILLLAAFTAQRPGSFSKKDPAVRPRTSYPTLDARKSSLDEGYCNLDNDLKCERRSPRAHNHRDTSQCDDGYTSFSDEGSNYTEISGEFDSEGSTLFESDDNDSDTVDDEPYSVLDDGDESDDYIEDGDFGEVHSKHSAKIEDDEGENDKRAIQNDVCETPCEGQDDENEPKCILYKHVTLILLKNKDAEKRPSLLMEINFVHSKGEENNPTRKRFLFWENDNLLLCPVAHILALAIHDRAFAAPSLNSARNIFRAEIPTRKNCRILRWREDIRNTPVFGQATRVQGVLRTTKKKPLQPEMSARFLKTLGQLAGFEEPLTHYCVRRGAGNAVDNNATSAELEQIMGHQNPRTFQHYINEVVKCDVQSAFLGQPSRKSLLASAWEMSLTADPNAPTTETAEQRAAIENHPEILGLCETRNALTAKIKAVKRSGKPEILAELESRRGEIKRELQRRRKSMRDRQRKQNREEYFEKNDTMELEAQFTEGFSKDQEPELKEKPTAPPLLEERRRVTEIFCEPASSKSPDDQLAQRIKAVEALAALCRRREAPKRDIDQHFAAAVELLDEVKPLRSTLDRFPLRCGKVQCLFCMGDERLSYEHRITNQGGERLMFDHISLHFPEDAQTSIACPHPVCKEHGLIFRHSLDLMRHAHAVHDVELFPLKCRDGQCLFCMGDESLPYEHRIFNYKTKYLMWDHIHVHYPEDAGVQVACLHPVCKERGTILSNTTHFRRHAHDFHGIRLRV